ncbi:XRE family transcriptional regulator [Pelistega indica]|uniref:XRE family transcriptional regulator n=1 Tax=Pelistega indica TaxID=1414851 RepID=V8G957_9BURK|nr:MULTISPECIES: HigA family addiction module antitoxin [Pelistega]ETD73054.1 XRE family transcriptional regulator [Pelistega indica]
MARMYDPPHPGLLLKEYLENLTVTEVAKGLGVTRSALSRIVNGKTGISPEMALRLEEAFGATKAETWLKMQLDYDLWQAEQKHNKSIVRPFHNTLLPTMT